MELLLKKAGKCKKIKITGTLIAFLFLLLTVFISTFVIVVAPKLFTKKAAHPMVEEKFMRGK